MVDYSASLMTGEQTISQRFSLHDQVKTVVLDLRLSKYLPQYGTIDGTQNIWVVKPSYNARGVGVYCTNKLKDIIQQGKKTQSKIV